jgi:hypothetical protein
VLATLVSLGAVAAGQQGAPRELTFLLFVATPVMLDYTVPIQ